MTNSRSVLFICTGNYYRSRYAELLFNARATTRNIGWHSFSRGLLISPLNPGPIAHVVIERLADQIPLITLDLRFPLQLTGHDLANADLIIALDKTEHLPYVQRLFPEWADRIQYWDVADGDFMSVAEALDMIDYQVEQLLNQLEGVHQ